MNPPQRTPTYDPPIPGAFPGAPVATTATSNTSVSTPGTLTPGSSSAASSGYPPHPPNQKPQFTCTTCSAALDRRPRIHCLECANHDACTVCYLTRRVSHPHEAWHNQQTILPPNPPVKYPVNLQAMFTCDICHLDITTAPRARCIDDCVSFDLCSDCHVIGAEGRKAPGEPMHIKSHRVHVVTDWTPETKEKLVDEEFYPSNAYLDMIDAIFNFILKHYNPPSEPEEDGKEGAKKPGHPGSSSLGPGGAGSAGLGLGTQTVEPREHRNLFDVLEQSKLARFYRAMGMPDNGNCCT